MLRRCVLLGLFGVAVAAAPTWAQSKRYPPEPVDTDRVKAARSALWENAANPDHEPYQDLIDEARAALADRTDDQYQLAVARLDQAIKLLPGDPDAYALRGDAHLLLRDWARCATDLEAAAARAPRGEPADRKAAAEQRRKLGLCLARAGRLADAERVLAEAAMSGTGTGEMLMRLGEVRIAMGKLDEAIAALTAALDASDVPSQALTRWLLAAAYDRGRRPAEAIAEARLAVGLDRSFSSLTSQSLPLIGAGETEYLLGLAWALSRDPSRDPPRPEHALVYFRRFAALAPDSPWRKRAEDHLRELGTAALPEAIERRGGGASLDLDATRTLVRRAMPAMRACMAKLPGSVIEVLITRAGPRGKPAPPPRPQRPLRPPPRPHRPPYGGNPYQQLRVGSLLPPPDGTSVALALDLDGVSRADLDAAVRCIDPIAAKLPMPAVKEAGAWYKASFFVVAP